MINQSFQPSIVREAIKETSQNIEKLKNRYDVVKDQRAEINQYEDQETGVLRQEFDDAGGNYDIIDGDKVHELTDDQFQHNVGTLRQVLQRKKQRGDFE